MKHSILAAAVLVLVMSSLFSGGAGGCGGGGTAATDDETDQAGLSVYSLSSVPVFSGFVNPIVLVQNSPGPPALKTQTTESSGFCPEFCYLKQSVLEAVRQYESLDFALCLARKANNSSGEFDFPSVVEGGCDYFDVVFPSGTAGLPETLRFRLCRSSNHVTLHTCEGGVLQQEMILDNDDSAESVSGTLTSHFQNPDGCEDKSQVTLSTNCEPDEFANSECQASLTQTVCGCYGEGTIGYQVTGGETSPLVLESSFSAGGLGSATSGDFNFCSLGQGTAGSSFCTKSQSSGGFPAIATAEVPLSEIEGCEGLTGASALCPDSDFDPDAYDPIYPSCPFQANSSGTCSFAFDEVACCDLSGGTLDELGGTPIDSSTVSSLFDEVSARTCPAAVDCAAFAFVDSWDCQPAGEAVVTIDLAAVASSDFDECTAILDDVNNFTVVENCSEQAADAEGEEIISEVETLADCQADNQCSGGQVCEIFDDGGTPGTSADDTGGCVDPPTACAAIDNGADECAEGEACAFDPDFGDSGCVPAFVCPASCAPETPCNAATGACAFVSCNYLLAGDCDAKLGAGYTCNPTTARCEP